MTARAERPLSADAQRVLARIPTDWSNETDVRRDLHDGLFLAQPSIANILNTLERRGLIERGAWLNHRRPLRRKVPAEALS